MRYIDRFCQVLGGISIFTVGLSMTYVCVVVGFYGELIAPPATAFIGLFGIMVAMLIYAACHLLKGDLFK